MVPEELTPEIRADAEAEYRDYLETQAAENSCYPEDFGPPEPFNPSDDEIEEMHRLWQAQFGPKNLNN